MARRIVDLPLPDGPKIASTSPRPHVEGDVERNRAGLAQPDAQAACQPRRVVRRRSVVVSISVPTATASSVAAITPAPRSSKACMRS